MIYHFCETRGIKQKGVVTMDTISIQTRIHHIDSRVKQLERINDEYSTKHGIMNYGIYNKIQNLMNERDRLYAQLA